MTKVVIKAADGVGAVDLYHNANLKFETNADGCLLGDSVKLQLGAGPDLEIYSDGTDSFVQCPSTGNNLTIESDNHLYLKVEDSDDAIKCVAGGAVELYHNNVKKLETTSGGATLTGDLTINDATPKVSLIDTNDSNSEGVVQHTSGNLYLKADDNQVMGSSSIRFQVDGAEKARILTGGGMTFNGDTAAANALDDYEEGEWTITFTNSGAAAQNSSSHTKGRYIKIGGMVYFHFMINFGSSGTVPPNNGTVFKSSLPFSTPSDSTNSLSRHVFTIMHQEIKMDNSRQEVVGYLTQNTSHMQYFECGDDLTWQTLKNSGMNRTAMQMYVSGVMATV